MQWLLSLLSAGIVVPILVFYGEALSVQGFRSVLHEIDINHAKNDELLKNDGDRQVEAQGEGLRITETGIRTSTGGDPEEGLLEEPDFQDEEEELINWEKENTPSVESVTHLRYKNGEVLIPCFGMWWPVGGGGGGGGAYYYGGDYYGDYRKKRRRSRKQKKAARMKKKKA